MEELKSKSAAEVETKLRDVKAKYDAIGGTSLNRKGGYVECGIGLCLFGMINAMGVYSNELGVDHHQKLSLEAGFCDWPEWDNSDSKADPEFFALGEKLAAEWCA